MAEWIKSYRAVEALDFDVLVPGHGSLFAKQDVTEAREFFEDLKADVEEGMRAGKSLQELQQSLMLPKYKGWMNYERLRVPNITAAYHNLKNRP
jgi:hypothetical protein